MTSIRHQIGIIADSSLGANAISREVYEDYKKVAAGADGQAMSMEMLESTRKFASKHEDAVLRIHTRIQSARRSKIASEGDENFLMEQLNVKSFDFDKKADFYEKRVDEKLDHMRLDKNKYTELANHKLIKDIGYLKVDGNTRIDFPNETGFMKLTVPERRELLESIKEGLPKAEKYAEECEDKEGVKLVADYTKKLNAARKKGIIGEHTYKEFMYGDGDDKGFEDLDNDEKKYWLSEFDNQMKPYEALQGQIDTTLKGDALKEMKSKIDDPDSGYTELFAEFGKVKDAESNRLNKEYKGELEKYRMQKNEKGGKKQGNNKGVIGKHTIDEFNSWMKGQDFPGKYEAAEKLKGEMLHYDKLWQKTEDLSEDRQEFMKSKIDVWGYTELNQQYERFKNGEEVPQTVSDDTDMASLSMIRSKEVRNAIVETDEMLEKQGKGKRRTFIEVLDKMFRNVSRDKFDASSFEGGIRAKAANDNDTDNPSKGREANTDVNESQIEEDANLLEEAGAKVTKQIGFTQVESKDKTGKKERKAQVTINEGQGMERLFTEDGKHKYRGDVQGGNDDLSLAIKASSGRKVELNLQEIDALRGHLKKSEETELDKAA